MKFTRFQSLRRLHTTEVEDIEEGTCYIFPKLDGTNGSIWMDSQGNLKAGSRNRELSLDNDNQGFYAWVLENKDKFNDFFKSNSDCILYGEWLVPHSLKTYKDSAWRDFYIFDVLSESEGYLHYDIYSRVLDQTPLKSQYITPMCIIHNPTEEQLYGCLERNTYLIKDGQGVGEGIVIKNYGWVNKYGRPNTWAKLVTNEFKEKSNKEFGSPVINSVPLEQKIVDKYVPDTLVSKVYEKIRNERGGWESKFIPQLLHTVFYDLIREECWEFVKEFKNPKINFNTLQQKTFSKVKELKKEIF